MTEFEQQVLALPSNWRSFQANPGVWRMPPNQCWFGIPADGFFGWQELTHVPADAVDFHFYLGNLAQPLLAAFCRSPWAQTVHRLNVGKSSYNLGGGLDYRDTVATMSHTVFPALEHLGIGIWELFSNSHCLFGKVGEIAPLLQNCPKLKTLNIGGWFTLGAPLQHPAIEAIDIQIDDYCTMTNGGALSQTTLDHLLTSELPQLQSLSLDLEIEELATGYTLPDSFLNGHGMPQLQKIEFAGHFAPGTAQRVAQSALAQRGKFSFEETGQIAAATAAGD